MRLAGRQRLGFYPLPIPEAERIRRFLRFPDLQCSALDPSIGDGVAFAKITSDAKIFRYGIELDAYRAERDDHTYEEIAKIFNARGWQTRVGNSYKPERILRIQERYGLKRRYDRLREAGYLTLEEMARVLGISERTVQERRKRGLLKGVRLNDKPEYLYEYLNTSRGAAH